MSMLADQHFYVSRFVLSSVHIFSSPDLKAQVSFSDRLLSVVCLSVRLTSGV
jgi:hypothetical protein